MMYVGNDSKSNLCPGKSLPPIFNATTCFADHTLSHTGSADISSQQVNILYINSIIPTEMLRKSVYLSLPRRMYTVQADEIQNCHHCVA